MSRWRYIFALSLLIQASVSCACNRSGSGIEFEDPKDQQGSLLDLVDRFEPHPDIEGQTPTDSRGDSSVDSCEIGRTDLYIYLDVLVDAQIPLETTEVTEASSPIFEDVPEVSEGDMQWVDANTLDVDGECIADCAEKECGDDGCGGDCGTCANGMDCSEGLCHPVCPLGSCVPQDYYSYPDCIGEVQWPCSHWECSETECCERHYTPWYDTCCTEDTDCVPCFKPGTQLTIPCGDSEGELELNLCAVGHCNFETGACDILQLCNDGNTCTVDSCAQETLACTHEPKPDGTSCNADFWPYDYHCLAGNCICDPNCSEAECGGDGCGGSCGTCDVFETCVNGGCQPGAAIWTNIIGGAHHDRITCLDADAQGNLYATGTFISPQVQFGDLTLANAGGPPGMSTSSDMMLLKMSSEGIPIWARSFGDIGEDKGASVAVHPNGVFMLGTFTSEFIDFGSGPVANMYGSALKAPDTALVSFDLDGELNWAKALKTCGQWDYVAADTDVWGDVFVAGTLDNDSVDFGGGLLESHGFVDLYLVKFAPDSSHLWSGLLGGEEFDMARSIVVSSDGGVVVTGGTTSPTFSFGESLLLEPGDTQAKAATFRMNPDGGLEWYWGASGGANYFGNDLAVDDSGKTYVVGQMDGGNLALGENLMSAAGAEDAVIFGLSSTGELLWATSFGGTWEDVAKCVCLTPNGIVVGGEFTSEQLHVGSKSVSKHGTRTLFLVGLTTFGQVLWIRTFGGVGSDWLEAMACTGDGRVIMAGETSAQGIDFGNGGVYPGLGANDAFVATLQF